MLIKPISQESFEKLKYRKASKEITGLFDEIMSSDSKIHEIYWENHYKNITAAQSTLHNACKKRGYRLIFHSVGDRLFAIKED